MYEQFAIVYDRIMRHVPYERWSRRIEAWINAYGISQKCGGKRSGGNLSDTFAAEKNLVVELGCGTGTMTELLAGRGYDMIGIDASAAMLAMAAEKKVQSKSQTLYLCQKIQEMDLYSSVGTFVCIFDTLNYLLDKKDVQKTLRLVQNYLHPGGIFIFDFNTPFNYEQMVGERTIAESREDYAYVWDNHYHYDRAMTEHEVKFFIKDDDGRYSRYQETHFQKGYSFEQLCHMAGEAGLQLIDAVDDATGTAPDDESGRIFMVLRK